MLTLIQDLRFGARMLWKHPGFTFIAVLTLALGIGANSAIFSVVNSVLLRDLPYREPQRLMMVWSDRPLQQAQSGWTEFPFTVADFRDLRDQNQSLEQMAAFTWDTRNITGSGNPELLSGVLASANLFALLGVEARTGRAFLPEEGQPGNDRVVILSDRLWQRRFGSDPKIIGEKISLNNEPYTVVGVAPPDFQFPPKATLPSQFSFPPEIDFYTPLALTPAQLNDRGHGWLAVIARLKSQTGFEQARADLVGIAERLAQQYPNSNKNESVRLVSIHQQLVGKVQTALLALMGAVGFVLLIACVNVANLLLARGTARHREMAIRAALGAGRWRVIGQLLTESLLLAVIAGVLALLLAVWGVDLLRTIVPDNMPRAAEISVDVRVFGFTLAVSLLTGIIFGLIPALQGSRTDLNETLTEGGRSSAGGRRNRLGGVLVVTEVALALLLLVGAGLMLRSFIRLMSIDPGFDPQNVLTMAISLPGSKYQGPQREAFFQQLFERTGALPGVRTVGAVFPQLGLGGANTGVGIEGRPLASQGEPRISELRFVSPDYFKAMKIELLRGRVFTGADGIDTKPIIIINEAMARQYWPNGDPIGRRVSSTDDNFWRNPPHWREIVGVVEDARYTALETEARAQVYIPFAQYPAFADRTMVVRTDGDPLSLVAAMRSEVQAIDKDQPISHIRTMEDMVAGSVSQRRFNMFLLSILAGLALLMAAAGIYGVMSYSVEQRTHEIGLRLALGAQSRDVLKLVVKRGMILTLVGVALGLGASLALTRLMESLLFGVSATDGVTFALVPLLLMAVALLACYLPARRATKVDPMVAMRCQ
jgi:putative ABC transport system permease protein